MTGAGVQQAWRIVKTRYAADAFSGEGARLYGGRWNSPGQRMVYTAQSESLAVLEMLVHLDASMLLSAYSLIEVQIPRGVIDVWQAAVLPANWRAQPVPVETQLLGDAWLQGETAVVLEVPSVIVPREKNYLINPAHPDFRQLHIGNPEPYLFDQRLTG